MTAEYALAETSVGWRPNTPDNAPIFGGCALEGLTLATGHHRNGVLLTPVSADVAASYVADRRPRRGRRAVHAGPLRPHGPTPPYARAASPRVAR